MKMHAIKVKNNDPNNTLSDWLSKNQTCKVRTTVLRDKDDGTRYWHIYYVD